MNLLRRGLAQLGYEKRDADQDNYQRLFRTTRGSGATGEHTVTGLPVVFACIQLISETMGSIPLSLYRRDDRQPAVDHPLHKALHDKPNSLQTAMEFREQMVAACLFTGNAYAKKVIDQQGRVVALLPLLPSQVQVERANTNQVRYIHTPESGGTEVLLQEEVLHLKYRSTDGIRGLSPIAVAAATFRLAVEQNKYSEAFLRHQARPSMAFRLPEGGALKEEAFNRLKIQLDESFAGINSGKSMLLEGGMEAVALGVNNRDSQFIEQSKINDLDICRIFRVPPPSVGILDNATYSNITEQSAMLVKHCLRPWMVRIEQCMKQALLTPEQQKTYTIEHNAEGLLRGSQTERYEAYRIAREWGWLNVNEIRKLETMQGIGDAGDEYRSPMNSEPLISDRPDSGDANGA